MRKWMSAILMLLLCLTLTQGVYATAAPDPFGADEPVVGASVRDYSFTVTYGQAEARSMLSMINSFRTGRDAWYWAEDNQTKVACSDLEALIYDYNLEEVAMLRAAELVLSLSHTRPNGENCYSAHDELGYSYTVAAENLYADTGTGTARMAFNAWREDNKTYSGQGHRRNMLNGNINRVGIAHVIYNGTHYWVQEFAYNDDPITETEALNTSTEVSISISDDMIEDIVLTPSMRSINVDEKASVILPTVNVVLRVSEHWSRGADARPNVSYTWSVNDQTYATISDNQLIGVAAGSTRIATTIFGRETTVNVTVNHVQVIDPAVEATCLATGLTEGSHCSACGITLREQRTVPKKDHTIVTDLAVEATCTETGLTEGSHCSACETVFTEQQIVPALGHDWGEWVVTIEATSESTGEQQRVCSRDSSHVDTQVIPKIPKSGSGGFSDVQDPKHAYYNAIYWAADAGITKGYPDGTFGINRSCTRGEMIMFLWRYAGKPAPKTVSTSPFKDVAKTHAFYKAILWASQKGITKGYPDGTFGIDRNVSRGESMMFLWRLKGKPAPTAVSKSPFKDVPTTHTFYKAILWGYQKKITTGYTSGAKKGTFGIDENCTRGQIVTFLYRAK